MKKLLVAVMAVLGLVVFSATFAADAQTLTVGPDVYTYSQEEFSFSVANPKVWRWTSQVPRFEFFIRRLVESGEQKAPFDRWIGRGEFARILDLENKANVYFLILRKDTPEVAIGNILKVYAGDLVYRVESRNRSEFAVSDDVLVVKEIYDMDINNHKRRIVFGYAKVNPTTTLFVAVWNRGLYNAPEPEGMIDKILASLKVRREERGEYSECGPESPLAAELTAAAAEAAAAAK